MNQGLSQDLETGYSMLSILTFLGILFFQWSPQYTCIITTINMNLLRYDILIQCHGICNGVK